jgi:hypothetical protein
LVGRALIDFRVVHQLEPGADRQVTHAAYAVHAFGLRFMGEHAVKADAVEVSRGIARMRNVDHVLRQQTRQIIARLPLVDNGLDLGFRHSGQFVVPGQVMDIARNQAAGRREQGDRVALFGARVAGVVSDRSRRALRQSQRVIAEHQRVNGRFVALHDGGPMAVVFLAGLASLDEYGHAVASQDAPDEMRGRFVGLLDKFARRITVLIQARQIEIDGACHHGATLAQFVQQDLQDFREGLVTKDTPVSTLLHQRQRVADRQLVTRQGAVGLTRPNIGDDGVDGVQIALVGRDLD